MWYDLDADGGLVAYEAEEPAEFACGVEAASEEGGDPAGMTGRQARLLMMMGSTLSFFVYFSHLALLPLAHLDISFNNFFVRLHMPTLSLHHSTLLSSPPCNLHTSFTTTVSDPSNLNLDIAPHSTT